MPDAAGRGYRFGYGTASGYSVGFVRTTQYTLVGAHQSFICSGCAQRYFRRRRLKALMAASASVLAALWLGLLDRGVIGVIVGALGITFALFSLRWDLSEDEHVVLYAFRINRSSIAARCTARLGQRVSSLNVTCFPEEEALKMFGDVANRLLSRDEL